MNMPEIIQTQMLTDVLRNRCFKKFRKIHRKTPVPESVPEGTHLLTNASVNQQ